MSTDDDPWGGHNTTQTATIDGTDIGLRRIDLTRASQIRPKPVFWLWKKRLALGTIGLLAGREGTGKSTLAYWITARLTCGELYGHYHGRPKSVLVCATEDSWEHTIVPRLMAAGANLDLVYRIEVVNALDVHVGLSLPRDLLDLEKAAIDTDAALLLLDPLMSRLGDLDTHRDAEVRQALEPLMAIADRTRMAILGLIHHNKSGSTDPLQLVMGSRAFTAVARSVHTVVDDPDDDAGQRRLFGTPKNNLGRNDLPTFSFTIAGQPIETDEGIAWTGKIEWGDEREGSIDDVMRRAADVTEDRTAVSEAADWLGDYVASQGGQVASSDAKKAGRVAGHSERTLKRAVTKLRLVVSSSGFPRSTYWEFPAESVPARSGLARAGGQNLGPTGPTGPTELRGDISQSNLSLSLESGQWGQSGHTSESPRAPARELAELCALCHAQPAPPGRGICQTCADLPTAQIS
jgi:AAA domain